MCLRSASARSENGILWEIGAAPPCLLGAAPGGGGAAPGGGGAAPGGGGAAPAAAAVECFCCYTDTVAPLSCPAGHHLCETCTNRTLADFDFGTRNAFLNCLGLTQVDINMMPFVCQKCAEDNRVAAFFPAAACLKFCSQATINSLFNKLRKFQLSSGGPVCLSAVQSAPSDPSEIVTVTEMLRLFFEPPKCPSCRTPFSHDGGCMSMACKGRPGLFCKVKFCLWCVCTHCKFMLFISLSRRCMKIPQELKVMGLNPNASSHDLDNVAHEHAFACTSRCPARKTPGNSCLFPTEDMESSEWIVAWHAMKTIEKAMSFLRTHVAAGARDAVMKNPEVARMFHDAATIVRDRLQARPQDSASLEDAVKART